MEFSYSYVIIPIVAALIGWITNKVAIWLLYYPKKPFYVFGLKIQGVFPKRQQEIAVRIGEMVAENLLTNLDVKNQVFTTENVNQITIATRKQLIDYLNSDFKENNPFISIFLSKKRKEKIIEEMLKKLKKSILDLENNFDSYLENKVNIKQIVTQKVSALDSDEVNQLMQNVLRKELNFIEYIGGLIGFLVGILQVLFIILL